MVPIPRVGDVMWTRLPIVSGDQSLAGAAKVMLDNRTLGVVVNDVERRPSLVLTYRRLVKLLAKGVSVKEQVAVHGVHPPITIRLEDTVIEALETMKKYNVRFLPVVDDYGVLVGVVEPRHIAGKLWELLPHGVAKIEGSLRKIVVLSGDLTIRVAAKAMDENSVPEVFVKTSRGELRLMNEWDFLEAVATTNIDEAKVGDYAKRALIKVPAGFDAKSAVELMNENDVTRLLVVEENRERIVTITDLAFEAAKHMDTLITKTTGFVQVKVKPGKEGELAADLLIIPEVKEVYITAGEYDLLIRIETEDTRTLYRIVTEKIRSDPRILETRTYIGVGIAEKK